MADTQQQPQPVVAGDVDGSIRTATDAILGLMDPIEEKPETEEAQPTEEEESQPTEEDESFEEVSESTEADEEESEEAEEEEEESESDEEVEEPDIYTVKVDGEDIEVPLDELIKGYSRQSDYTKKTQELSEYRKQVDEALSASQQEIELTNQFRQQYVDAAQAAMHAQYAKLTQLNNTDWERLRTEDREEYLTKRDEYRELQTQVQAYQQNIDNAHKQKEAEDLQVRRRVLQDEHRKMVDILPQWEDQEFRGKVTSDLTEFALSKGFLPEEIQQLSDHRSVLILMQAKAFEEMASATETVKTKKVKNKPKVAKSGKGTQKKETASKQRAAQMKRLQNSGHTRDAASLLEDFV